VCLSLASQTSWRVEWSPAEKLLVCWSASLALAVPRPPSSCRAPMLTHTHEPRFRVPGLSLLSDVLKLEPRTTTRRTVCVVIMRHTVCRTNGGHTRVRCFVIFLIIRTISYILAYNFIQHARRAFLSQSSDLSIHVSVSIYPPPPSPSRTRAARDAQPLLLLHHAKRRWISSSDRPAVSGIVRATHT